MEIQTTTKLHLFDCTECGAPMVLTENLERGRLRDSHRTFYCVNGHRQHFPAMSEAEKLRKALHAAELEKTRLAQQAKAAQEASDRTAIKLTIAERAAERIKKRTAAGLCPCCNRTFQQLARHMQTKHPEVAKEKLP